MSESPAYLWERLRVARARGHWSLVWKLTKELQRITALPTKQHAKPVCELHDWHPHKLWPGQPDPPKGMCPECVADVARKPVGTTVYIDGSPRREVPQFNEVYASWLERQSFDPANVRSGSMEEIAALRRIDELREIETRSEKPGFVSIRNGAGFYKKHHRPRRRRARVLGDYIEV